MGLTFSKSIRIGGLRLNLSRSGIGVSAGVRGARIGVNAKVAGTLTAGATASIPSHARREATERGGRADDGAS